MYLKILLIVTYFTQWFMYQRLPRLGHWPSFLKVVSNREESVLGYINFMYYDTSMARCKNYTCLDIKRYTSLSLPFTRSWKSKDVEIVGTEIEIINSLLVRINCLWNVDRPCRGRVRRNAAGLKHRSRVIVSISKSLRLFQYWSNNGPWPVFFAGSMWKCSSFSPGGQLPIMACTGRLRPKGVPFSRVRYIKG